MSDQDKINGADRHRTTGQPDDKNTDPMMDDGRDAPDGAVDGEAWQSSWTAAL